MISEPKWFNRTLNVSMSLSLGTFVMVFQSSTRREAAISGRTAFLAPLTVTSPMRRFPPSITILSIA